LQDFRTAWKNFKDQIRVVTVSLDESKKTLDSRLRELHANWPHISMAGMAKPRRSLGINALPSVWILDKRGILRTINARSTYETMDSPASWRRGGFVKGCR
jgi:hypothetical protein